MIRFLGIVLILGGAVIFGYQGFTYVSANALPVRMEEWDRSLWFPPLVGGVAVASGLYLLFSQTDNPVNYL